jgi:cysteine desulfurase / selenocysteine lyase
MIDFSKSITDFRKQFPVTEKCAYFETASTGLVPTIVYDGVRRYLDGRYLEGGDSVWRYEDDEVGTLEMMNRSKSAIARMIHGTPDRIAFGQSSTQLFSMVTEAMDYAPEDNVVTIDCGWIGNRFAWQKREAAGLEVRYAQPVDGVVTPEQLMSLCDEHTRAVTVNLVESKTGYRMDMDKIAVMCKERNLLLFVDAVQALGALQVDVERWGVDLLVGNDYKWMMNFCGTGYAYISERLQLLIKHWGAGWMSDADRFNTNKAHLELREDAGRFEIGYPHAEGVYGLGLAAMQNEILGSAAVEEYVCSLATEFSERVKSTKDLQLVYDFPETNRCQIVCIKASADCTVSNEMLKEAGVVAHFEEPDENGERRMRMSFHVYNNLADLDQFFAVFE